MRPIKIRNRSLYAASLLGASKKEIARIMGVTAARVSTMSTTDGVLSWRLRRQLFLAVDDLYQDWLSQEEVETSEEMAACFGLSNLVKTMLEAERRDLGLPPRPSAFHPKMATDLSDAEYDRFESILRERLGGPIDDRVVPLRRAVPF